MVGHISFIQKRLIKNALRLYLVLTYKSYLLVINNTILRTCFVNQMEAAEVSDYASPMVNLVGL